MVDRLMLECLAAKPVICTCFIGMKRREAVTIGRPIIFSEILQSPCCPSRLAPNRPSALQPPSRSVSYAVRNSSRRLLALLARRSIGGQSLQDGPSAALRRGRVLAGDQIAVDDHVWVASRCFRIDAAVLLSISSTRNGTTCISSMAASPALAKPVTNLPLTKGHGQSRNRHRPAGRNYAQGGSSMFDRIAFVKIGWSELYQGGPVVGRFGDQNWHERYNFMPGPDGIYYAYVPPIGQARAAPSPQDRTGWLLIFVAAFEGNGPLTVVGWYEDASFADGYQARPEYQASETFETDAEGGQFRYCVSARQAYLIPYEQRVTSISGNHMRRVPIVYVRGQQQAESWRMELARVAEDAVAEYAPIVSGVETTVPAGILPVATAEHRKRGFGVLPPCGCPDGPRGRP
jgi:hypothetical protein